MLDPGALGTLIIRNDAQRADAERVGAGVPEGMPDARQGPRVVIARALRWLATRLAGPERSEGRVRGAPPAASMGLTWTDR